MFSLLSDSGAPTSQIDKNIYEILFTPYNQRDTDGLKEYLNRSDVLDAFRILQEIDRELTAVKLENLVLIDFLEKNDPKLLIGLDQVRRNTMERRRSTVDKRKSRVDSVLASPTLGRTESRSMSMGGSVVSSIRKVSTDYRLNYRVKAEMAEKLALEIHKNCEALEAKGTHDIKILNAHIEELRYQSANTEETINNFKQNFVESNTLENATEKQMEKHLRKFINYWLKNGRALLGTMRLKITSLQEQCHQQRTTLITKADLSGMLGPVDFEQLKIKRDDQTKSLEEKNISLTGLKEVTGKASLALAKEKKFTISIEQKSRVLSSKTADVVRRISKLEQEARSVEKEVELAEESLNNLKIQVEAFEAPSVTDYIHKKQELIALEKEQKLLQRKGNIQNIKLKNFAIKLKMRNERE